MLGSTPLIRVVRIGVAAPSKVTGFAYAGLVGPDPLGRRDRGSRRSDIQNRHVHLGFVRQHRARNSVHHNIGTSGYDTRRGSRDPVPQGVRADDANTAEQPSAVPDMRGEGTPPRLPDNERTKREMARHRHQRALEVAGTDMVSTPGPWMPKSVEPWSSVRLESPGGVEGEAAYIARRKCHIRHFAPPELIQQDKRITVPAEGDDDGVRNATGKS
jgi:hypothetical protein